MCILQSVYPEHVQNRLTESDFCVDATSRPGNFYFKTFQLNASPASEDVLVTGEGHVAADDGHVRERCNVEKLTHVLPKLGAFLQHER